MAWARVCAAIATRRPARCDSAAATRDVSRVLPLPGGDGTTVMASPFQVDIRTSAVTGSLSRSIPGHVSGFTGDGGAAPRLEFVRGRDPVKEGDRVLTSGDGGLYPRGLPVGVADKDIFGQWRVRLYSDRSALDYVRIMLFTDFSQLVDDQALNNRAPPPISASEKTQIDQAVAARIAVPHPGSPEAQAATDRTATEKAAADKTAAEKATGAKPGPGKPPAGKPASAARPAAAPAQARSPHGPKVLHPTRTSPGNPVAVVPGQR